MNRSHGTGRTIASILAACLPSVLQVSAVSGRPVQGALEITSGRTGDEDLVGPAPDLAKVAQSDTVWIADWSFELQGGGCTDAGWLRYDNRIRNDGSNYWSIDGRFDGTGGIVGRAAVLSKHDLLWARDGYGNDWDYSIVLEYRGASTLTFDLLADGEPGFDFVNVEADSAGASEARIDYAVDPDASPTEYRVWLVWDSGLQNATVGPIALPDFGVPATTHEVYIRFDSDGGYSDQDGLYSSAWNAGLVVDNIAVTGGLAYTEDFEGVSSPHVAFLNTAVATPFGEWARVYQHITDNAYCDENTTCAWLWSDPSLPAYYPDMAFGPGGAVVRKWLDDIVVSPWVVLGGAPNASTVISFRRFGGNSFPNSRIVLNWSVRSKARIDNTDTQVPGDSIDAFGPWRHVDNFGTLSSFVWLTSIGQMTPAIDPGALEVQVRFRVVDYQFIAGGTVFTLDPGPGPYIDRVRIGRRGVTGPLFSEGADSRSQGQDCFAAVQNAIAPGEHFSPSTSRFGSCAFSSGGDLAAGLSTLSIVTGDSVTIVVTDARDAGGITAVLFYGAIVRGPHAGRAPAPYVVASNGFFEVVPDSARGASGAVVTDTWSVDLDDTYFRGGDRLLYYWSATDAAGGTASDPSGMTVPPASVGSAELATGGLFEVSFLPSIDWDPSYLARVAADPHGDVEPTPAEIGGSVQTHCILYTQQHATRRRSGDTNRTAFMYTLDRLGYREHYDVYDVQGYGDTNNQLGGRAAVEQCTGYALVIQDNGRGLYPDLPHGYPGDQKVDQRGWFASYLAQGIVSDVGRATVWLIGEDIGREGDVGASPLGSYFGVAFIASDQDCGLNPDVVGQGSFTFANGNLASFDTDHFALDGSCNSQTTWGETYSSDYDGATDGGAGVITHRYAAGTAPGLGAVKMNKDTNLHWNTIWMGFGWFDIRDPQGEDPSGDHPSLALAQKILGGVLPEGCVQGENPTDGGGDPTLDALPRVTALQPNIPNPFNPATAIRFDLAVAGRVQLRIYDVGGRVVRTLARDEWPRGRHALPWNGLDDSGLPVASGVYLCRLEAPDARVVRKLLLVR